MGQDSGEARSDDALLVESARRGDSAAFGALVSRYQDRLWRFLASWVRQPADREDLMQEVFLAAYKGIGKFRGESRFSTWLMQIAVNQARGRRRLLARRPREVDLPGRADGEEALASAGGSTFGTLEDNAGSPFDHAAGEQLRVKVWQLIERLPEEWQSAMRLRYLEEMTHAEIAEVLDTPVGTVKAQLHRGRQRLADWLAEEGLE